VQSTRATVVPVFFEGQNSRLFQLASQISATLRLSLLFKEVAARIGTRMAKPVEVRTRVRLRITVRADDVVPSGVVKVRIRGAGKKRAWTETLTRRGRTGVLLPSFKRTGRVKVVVRYRGDHAVEAARKVIRFTVVNRSTGR